MDEHELKVCDWRIVISSSWTDFGDSYVQEKERIEFETKQAELRTQAESKTSKNRARRQKRKQHRVKKQEGTTTQAGAPFEGSNNDSDQESDDDSDTQQKRRKLGAAPIAEGITFKSQNMDEDDEESDGDKPARRRPSETKSAFLDVNASAPGLDAIPVIEPTGITIIEDEWWLCLRHDYLHPDVFSTSLCIIISVLEGCLIHLPESLYHTSVPSRQHVRASHYCLEKWKGTGFLELIDNAPNLSEVSLIEPHYTLVDIECPGVSVFDQIHYIRVQAEWTWFPLELGT